VHLDVVVRETHFVAGFFVATPRVPISEERAHSPRLLFAEIPSQVDGDGRDQRHDNERDLDEIEEKAQQEYRQLAQRIQNDRELQRRLKERMKQQRR